MAHDGEEEDQFQAVDQSKDTKKDVEAGEGKAGESAEEGVAEKRHPEHFGGKEQAGFQLPVFGVKDGKGEGEGHRTDHDEE